MVVADAAVVAVVVAALAVDVAAVAACRVYYGGTGSSLRGHRHHQGWEFYTGKFLEHCLAKVSVCSTERGN